MKPVLSIFYTFLIALPLLVSCTKTDPETESKEKTTKPAARETSTPAASTSAANTAQDRQVRLEFGGIDHNTRTTDWTMSPYETTHLIKFDKRNYPDVTSIIFTASMFTSDAKTKCLVELYNVTDGEPIAGSALESNKKSFVFVDSGNIYDSLPEKEITLAVRVKSARKGVMVSTGARHLLFLNR